MPLNEEEESLLKKLQKKAKEPAAPSIGKSVSFSVDLGDDKQVERADRLGLLAWLRGDDDDEDDTDKSDKTDEEESEDDDSPKRRSYFGD